MVVIARPAISYGTRKKELAIQIADGPMAEDCVAWGLPCVLIDSIRLTVPDDESQQGK